MSNKNKSVFHVIREKGVARVAVALLAASLLAGIALASAPAVADLPPGPTAPAHADLPPGPGAPAHA